MCAAGNGYETTRLISLKLLGFLEKRDDTVIILSTKFNGYGIQTEANNQDSAFNLRFLPRAEPDEVPPLRPLLLLVPGDSSSSELKN